MSQKDHQMNLDMRKKLDDTCMGLIKKLVVEKNPQIQDQSLLDILFDAHGTGWRRLVEKKLSSVRNKVLQDIGEADIDLQENYDYPFRFMANSIVIHTLEISAKKSSHYDDLEDVRENNFFGRIGEELEKIHEERNDDS